jgi:hypothetical protein
MLVVDSIYQFNNCTYQIYSATCSWIVELREDVHIHRNVLNSDFFSRIFWREELGGAAPVLPSNEPEKAGVRSAQLVAA